MSRDAYTDHERALLFLYILEERGQNYITSSKQQIMALSRLAGWDEERAEAALKSCVAEGHAAKMNPNN